MNYFNELYNQGLETIKDKSVIFCGMVRDCGSSVKRIIPSVESLGEQFKDYHIVIFENNSKDDTKQVLNNWQSNNKRVTAICNDFDENKYKNIPKDESYYLPNSRKRIQKYVDYRNLYMEYLDNITYNADYVIIIDYDIARIDIKGVITSFGTKLEWDVITANGYSYSPRFKRRYHDTYALCELGHENIPQSIPEIISYRKIFSSFRKNMPLIRVYSAYGGLAIYKREILKNMRYKILFNNYDGVEVYCEHYSLYKQLAEKGYNKVYINPNMEIYYQCLSLNLIIKKINDILHGYK